MKKSKLMKDRPWLSQYKEGVKPNLVYTQSTMVGHFLEAVARYPENIAYEYFGRTCTYRELFEKIRATARGLKAQGVQEGDKVTICMPNTPEAIEMFYAVNMVGAIASMVHPLSGEKEIELYLNQAGSKFLFALDLVYDKVHNIVDNTNVTKIVIGSAGDNLKPIKKLLYKYKSRGNTPKIELTDDIMTWSEFINYGYDYTGEIACLKKAEDPAVILYSGGTSGDPKGIVLSNLNFNALAQQSFEMIDEAGPGDSVLAILPIFHGFGLGVCIHTPLCSGMKVLLIPQFDPKKFAKLIKQKQPNFVCAVPALYEALTKAKVGKNELSFIKCAIAGGDFMSAGLKNKVDTFLKEHGSTAEVRIGYGLTESSAASCVTISGQYREGSIGVPFPDTYYKIVHVGTHIEVPYGEDGEICISGPTVMQGYLDNLEETIQTLRTHDDGRTWLHTGDIGCMDEDGIVYFRQRVKRMIVSNGYNLYPSYIEQVINSMDEVFTSVVIGIPHPKKVQVAKAFVVLNEGYKPGKDMEKKIRAHCERNLAKYSLPSEIEFKESLPKTLVGKVAYRELEK